MRLATYNVESLFDRPEAMNLGTWEDGRPILEDFTRLNDLIQKKKYTDSTKSKLIEIMGQYTGLFSPSRESKCIRLREIQRKLIKNIGGGQVQVVVNGRDEWIGWFELVTGSIEVKKIENTARIIDLLKADVLCVIEAENRVALKHFNDDIMKKLKLQTFGHIMLIDGNDKRGIDVGIMMKDDYVIERMFSHVDDVDGKGTIFSRDCAEYEIRTPQGNILLLLINHLKSKGYGTQEDNDKKRFRQSTRVREIYDAYINKGCKYIAVAGDFNDYPTRWPIAPLVADGSTLTDIMDHPRFTGDDHPGTYDKGYKSQKFDYILMSPELSRKVTAGGVERRGLWAGEDGTRFPHLDTITKKLDAASDHAALWVDLNV